MKINIKFVLPDKKDSINNYSQLLLITFLKRKIASNFQIKNISTRRYNNSKEIIKS